MKKTRILVLILSLVLLFTACEEISQQPEKTTAGESGSIVSENREKASESTKVTEKKTAAYTEYTAKIPEIVRKEASLKLEAEDCRPSGSLFFAHERRGYSGDGYITGFYGGAADKAEFNAELDTNQHYDITVCAAADNDVKSSVSINGKKVDELNIKGTKNFVRITLHGIYMSSGENVITINSGDAGFDLDYIEITNNESVYDTDFELNNESVNRSMTPEAKILLKSLKANFGKKIITGQYVSDIDDKELEFIYNMTGKYPLIRFSDIAGYTGENPMMFSDETDAAIKWAEKGGIVGFMWYWNSPDAYSPSVYSKDTDFSLKAAMTKKDIAKMTISEIEKLYDKGVVNLECLQLINDIDAISNSLLVLADENIPVLWRPLHEAGGDWYWWGADGPEPYKWLYNLMYERMTEYHKLNNLIWVWNGQSEDYMVDSDKYDIASVDAYLPPETEYGSRYEQYQWLKSITDSGKLLAISECSSIPSIDNMLRDNSLWSFFGLWFGEYLMDSSGNLSEIYTRKEQLVKMYNSKSALTLDNFN